MLSLAKVLRQKIAVFEVVFFAKHVYIMVNCCLFTHIEMLQFTENKSRIKCLP